MFLSPLLTQLTWANARLECKKKKMDLANIETLEENKCVAYILEKSRKLAQSRLKKQLRIYLGKTEQLGTPFWQALNKIGQKNYTQWLSGTALSYDNWNTGEPAAFATENCVAMELILMSFVTR